MLLPASPASASLFLDALLATELGPDEILDAFDEAVLEGLGPIGSVPAITGDPALDNRIRAAGEARGYQRRPPASRPLVGVDGVRLQPEAAAAWEQLQAAAAVAGHRISVVSGHRTFAAQASLFRGRLAGTSDAAIDRALRTAAMPGYSKHHTGYAIDIRSSTGGGDAFRHTAAYAWLAADNWANAKAHGWLPSYPDGSRPAGPDLEPWEFVWIGGTNIVCADFTRSPTTPFCDTIGNVFATEIRWLHEHGVSEGCRPDRFCPTEPLTRAQAATLLWRLDGSPMATEGAPFDDVPPGAYFAGAVDWLHEIGGTTGTTPTTFSPDRTLSRAEFVTFLWRYAGRPEPEGTLTFADVAPGGYAANAVVWAAENDVTRGTSATTFSPAEHTDRGTAAALLFRFARR